MNSQHRRSTRLSFLNSNNLNELRSSLQSSEGTKNSVMKSYKTKKILMMGYHDTGKSSIALKFLYDFPDATNLGPEENYYTSIKYKAENFFLHLIDFAGIDEYSPIYATKHGLKVDGYILVYSVDNRKSFGFVQELREKLKGLNGRDMPSVLVANKCDLKDTRQVSTEEGKKLSKAFGIPYLEVSAKRHSTDVIKKVFEVMLRETIKEDQKLDDLKKLKNWDEENIEKLYTLFIFGSVLLALIGVFFVGFGIFNLLLYPILLQNQGLILMMLILNGFIVITLSLLGPWGMKRQESDCIAVFVVLVVFSVLLNIGCGVLKYLFKLSLEGDEEFLDDPNLIKEYLGMDPLIYALIVILSIVLVFQFGMASLSRELYIKKKMAINSRYATLKV